MASFGLTRRNGHGPLTFGARPTLNASGAILDVDSSRADQVSVVFQIGPTIGTGCDTFNPETELWIEGDAVSTSQEPIQLCSGESAQRGHDHNFTAVSHDRSGRVTLLNGSDVEVDSRNITIPGQATNGGDGGCAADWSCADDEVCSAGTCVPLNCGPNEVARNHECVPTDGNGGNGGTGCTTDADCPTGMTCQNGQCAEAGGGMFSQQELMIGGGIAAVIGGAYLLQQNGGGGGGGARRARGPRRR